MCPNPNDINNVPRTYGGIYKTKIGLLTIDELRMAGFTGRPSRTTSRNYLYNGTFSSWWTLSPESSGDYSWINSVDESVVLWHARTFNAQYVIPVINLSADVLFTKGDGSESNPYVVE